MGARVFVSPNADGNELKGADHICQAHGRYETPTPPILHGLHLMDANREEHRLFFFLLSFFLLDIRSFLLWCVQANLMKNVLL